MNNKDYRPLVYNECNAIAESVSSSGTRPDESMEDDPQWLEYLADMERWYEEQGLNHLPTPDWDTRAREVIEFGEDSFADGRSVYTKS